MDSGVITVYLSDQGLLSYDQARYRFVDASMWAFHNCKSFQGYEIVETADVSYEWDQIAEYRFTDPRDVTLFKIRWS